MRTSDRRRARSRAIHRVPWAWLGIAALGACQPASLADGGSHETRDAGPHETRDAGPHETPDAGGDAALGDDGGADGGPTVSPIVEDRARAATAELGPSGGGLEAVAADGTVYRFDVPPGALLGPIDITLTPLLELENRPLTGTLYAAVRLEPDGLLLSGGAVLTIAPADPIAPGELHALAFEGDAREYHEIPAALDGSGSVTVHVTHFSGAALAGARPGEIEDLRALPPSAAQSVAEAELARIAGAEAAGELTEPEARDARLAALTAWLGDEVEPRMAAAQTDDTIYELAAAGYLACSYFAQLLMLDGALEARFRALHEQLATALGFAWERTLDRCIAGDAAMPGRLAGLYGQRFTYELAVELDETRVPRCVRFDVSGSLETAAGANVFAMGVCTYDVGDEPEHIELPLIQAEASDMSGPLRAAWSLELADFRIHQDCNYGGPKPLRSFTEAGCDGQASIALNLVLQANFFRITRLRVQSMERAGGRPLECNTCTNLDAAGCDPYSGAGSIPGSGRTFLVADRVGGWESDGASMARTDYTSMVSGSNIAPSPMRQRFLVQHRPR
jgi:hypothetical protein